jgi:hypothetical protein
MCYMSLADDPQNHRWLPEGASAASVTLSAQELAALPDDGGWVDARQADGSVTRVWVAPGKVLR